jgi:hypothetical protein
MDRLQDILDRYEVSLAEANDLVVLQDYEIAIIVDDSGSMKMSSLPPEKRQLGVPNPSRWEELKRTVELLMELSTCFDPSGVDLFFLNRQHVKGICGHTDPKFAEAFQHPPSGTTPLTETLQKVAKEVGGEKPVLLFILTDGEPNGGFRKFASELTRLVRKESTTHTFKVQLMACSGNEDEIAWMGTLDKELTEIDCTDDYYSEKDEVMKKGMPKFSRGDWALKAMLGPVCSKFDNLDELKYKKPATPQPAPAPAPAPVPTPQPIQPMPSPDQTGAPGQYTVTIIGAFDLPNLDAGPGGKSDPYVRVTMGSEQVLRTNTVSNNLNPSWGYVKTINWDGINDLVFAVFDSDLFTKDDWMGQLVLPAAKLPNGVNDTFPLQVHQKYQKSGMSTPTITVKVERGATETSCCAGCSVM